MSRSTRIFEIIQLLRSSKRPLTAALIAEELEVTVRTVYRDIVSLQSMRVPIDGAAGVGYIMRPGFDLAPLMFSAEEVEAIAVGLSLLGRTGDSALKVAAQSVTRKIAAIMPAPETATLSDVSLYASQWHAVASSVVTSEELRKCIREQQGLQIDYQDEHGKLSSRNILPLAIVYYIEAIVLAAWCGLRQGFRHFRVDRIITCKETGMSFSSEGPSLRKRWRAEHQFL